MRLKNTRWVMMVSAALLAGPMTIEAADAPKAGEVQLVVDGLDAGKLKLITGRSVIVKTTKPYKRVSIADGEIAIAQGISPTSILVTPKKAGSTQLIVWDDDDKSQMIDLAVQLDMAQLQEQYKTLFPDAKIEVSTANGSVVLRGRVPNTTIAEQAAQVAAPYSTKVLSLLEIAGGKQVMLQVRFAEVSRSATEALGVNGAFSDGAFVGGSNIGALNPTNFLPGGVHVGDTPPFAGITHPGTAVNPSVTMYGAGQIGSFYLETFITALRQNNLLRILAEPNLVAISGQEANFLAGGEFPIPVAGGASTGGTSNVTVEFREFGVKLSFVPIVTGEGKIRLKVSPEVSDLDFTTAVRLQGFIIPGLTSRKVSTTIELGDGQTFAIAGLLNQNMTANKDSVPLLGDLPIVGALFRSVRYQRKETELVVLVTPRLAEPMNPANNPTVPGEKWRHPTLNELFFKGDLGGPAEPAKLPATGKTPPRFHGNYGFGPVQKGE